MNIFRTLIFISAFVMVLTGKIYSQSTHTLYTLQTFSASLNLLEENNATMVADGNLAEFSDNYDNEVNWQDAYKFTNPGENFSLEREGQLLAIERRTYLRSFDTLFFKLTKTTIRSYQFVFSADHFEEGTLCFLEDSYLGTRTPVSLSQPTKLNFKITPIAGSQSPYRFRIVFETIPNSLPVRLSAIKANKNNIGTCISWSSENEAGIEKYDIERSIDGRSYVKINSVASMSGAGHAEYSWMDIGGTEGAYYYRVACNCLTGKTVYSSVVKTAGSNLHKNIVYTNPLSGLVSIQLNEPAGAYHVDVYNSSGQMSQTVKINHTRDSDESFQLKSNLPGGTYYLKVSSAIKTVTTFTILKQ